MAKEKDKAVRWTRRWSSKREIRITKAACAKSVGHRLNEEDNRRRVARRKEPEDICVERIPVLGTNLRRKTRVKMYAKDWKRATDSCANGGLKGA